MPNSTSIRQYASLCNGLGCRSKERCTTADWHRNSSRLVAFVQHEPDHVDVDEPLLLRESVYQSQVAELIDEARYPASPDVNQRDSFKVK